MFRLYLAARGITTNESFKWECIEEAIYRGEIYKVVKRSSDETNSNTKGKPTAAVKRKTQQKEEFEEKKIESFDEIENIYDKGFLGNLKEVFFPPKF